jgi:hypothetical protein
VTCGKVGSARTEPYRLEIGLLAAFATKLGRVAVEWSFNASVVILKGASSCHLDSIYCKLHEWPDHWYFAGVVEPVCLGRVVECVYK